MQGCYVKLIELNYRNKIKFFLYLFCFGDFFSNISKIALFKKGLDKKILFSIGIPAVLFVIAGAFASRFIEVRYLQLALSIFLIGLSILFLIKKQLKFTPNKINSFVGGSLSGFFAG